MENSEHRRESLSELLMRFTPAALALAAVLATVSSAGMSQRPDSQISPASIEWMKKGAAAQSTGDLVAATDAYETALAADPRNRSAYIALAQVAQAQGLQGKAIRLYNDALLLDPNDVQALAGQGQAMLDKGALSAAKGNLAKLKSVCSGDCAPAVKLSAAIDKGVPPTVLSAKDVEPKPSAEPASEQP